MNIMIRSVVVLVSLLVFPFLLSVNTAFAAQKGPYFLGDNIPTLHLGDEIELLADFGLQSIEGVENATEEIPCDDGIPIKIGEEYSFDKGVYEVIVNGELEAALFESYPFPTEPKANYIVIRRTQMETGKMMLTLGVRIETSPSIVRDGPDGPHLVDCSTFFGDIDDFARWEWTVADDFISPILNLLLQPTYEIGMRGPGGGIVFHVTKDGEHGLEAAPEDQNPLPGESVASKQWCPPTHDIGGNLVYPEIPGIVGTSDTSPDPNSGEYNTPLIVAACGEQTAAGLASSYEWPNGQTDGFLPNKDELDLLFRQKHTVGGLTGELYWSSSMHQYMEIPSNAAWYQQFNDIIPNLEGTISFPGLIFIDQKDKYFDVRAVRAF